MADDVKSEAAVTPTEDDDEEWVRQQWDPVYWEPRKFTPTPKEMAERLRRRRRPRWWK
jgi:hypothetical protein